MDDFEKAVLFTFDQSGSVGPELRAQAEQYCAQARAQAPAVLWRACVERVATTQLPEVQFWCLQALEELIRQAPIDPLAVVGAAGGTPEAGGGQLAGYGGLPETEKGALRSSILSLLFRPPLNGGHPGTPAAHGSGGDGAGAPGARTPGAPAWGWPVFVRNKLCQVLAQLIQRDYPHAWGEPIVRIIEGLGQGLGGVDTACRALAALDEMVW